jgi:hypothetical protein
MRHSSHYKKTLACPSVMDRYTVRRSLTGMKGQTIALTGLPRRLQHEKQSANKPFRHFSLGDPGFKYSSALTVSAFDVLGNKNGKS